MPERGDRLIVLGVQTLDDRGGGASVGHAAYLARSGFGP
jgi:hypothetical protein